MVMEVGTLALYISGNILRVVCTNHDIFQKRSNYLLFITPVSPLLFHRLPLVSNYQNENKFAISKHKKFTACREVRL